MKCRVALAIVTCLAIGAVTMENLHAQASSDAEKIANAMIAAPAAVRCSQACWTQALSTELVLDCCLCR
jgi:hypothetical protein